MVSADAENKIEDLVKWRIEAYTRKINERLQENESKTSFVQKHLNLITDECHSEFQSLKSMIIQVTGEVLEQVQTSILP